MTKYLPYSTQWISPQDTKEVIKVLKSAWITQGPKIAEFEEKLASYCGAKYAVVFNSGTSALLAACFAAQITDGHEVILSPYTFVASANCFVWFGARPAFVDIDQRTLNIDSAKITKAITQKTKAIVAVDFAGLPCDWDQILKIAREHQLVVIDDAAHALGSFWKGKKLGTVADLTCFSFHPVKAITTAEGGAIVTNNKKYYQRLLLFRNHGIVKDAKLLKESHQWYYEVSELGLNLRMTDIQAALGISQLARIDQFINRRRKIVEKYNIALAKLPVILPHEPKDVKSAWHLYPLRLILEKLKVNREKIFDELKKAGLGVQVHYIPVHLHPYYKRRFQFKRGQFPQAEKVYESEISLPLYPKMTDLDVNFVIKTVINVIKKYQK